MQNELEQSNDEEVNKHQLRHIIYEGIKNKS